MKKILFVGCMAFLCFTLMLACQSAPSSGANTDGAAGQVSDGNFKAVYDRHRQGLILDGAWTYTVVSGDTLAHIARAEYQNGFYFPVIMLASSEIVLDPDKITPGMELTVPDIDANLNDPDAKGQIKQLLLEIADLEEQRNRHQDAVGLRELSASL